MTTKTTEAPTACPHCGLVSCSWWRSQPPAPPTALERIATASERIADLLESAVTRRREKGAPHGH